MKIDIPENPDLNESSSKAAKINQTKKSFDEEPSTSFILTLKDVMSRFMCELQMQFKKATSHFEKVQVLTFKSKSGMIRQTAQFF